jgi:hypothetical protein
VTFECDSNRSATPLHSQLIRVEVALFTAPIFENSTLSRNFCESFFDCIFTRRRKTFRILFCSRKRINVVRRYGYRLRCARGKLQSYTDCATVCLDMTPTAIRAVICSALLVPPDRNNWSDYPNVWGEVQTLLAACAWYKVYDVAEALWRTLRQRPELQQQFRTSLNGFLQERGIGWELNDQGQIAFRGGEAFMAATTEAVEVLRDSGRSAAATEIHEALRDISRRPEPDRTGAIQHAMAALECTAREVTGNANATLGVLIPRLNLPRPLDDAVEKLWGYASDRARQVREGRTIDDDEAELVVSTACSVCIFLAKRRDR